MRPLERALPKSALKSAFPKSRAARRSRRRRRRRRSKCILIFCAHAERRS
jgi:hypothetical protein